MTDMMDMNKLTDLTEVKELGSVSQHYDIFMDIGKYFQGFQEQLAEFAISIFGAFGL